MNARWLVALVLVAGCRSKPSVELTVDSVGTSEMVAVPGQTATYWFPDDGNVYVMTDLGVRYTRCDGAAAIPADDEASAMQLPADEAKSFALFYSHLATLTLADGKTFRGKGGQDGPSGKTCVECSSISLTPCADGANGKLTAVFEVPKDASLDGASVSYRDGKAPLR